MNKAIEILLLVLLVLLLASFPGFHSKESKSGQVHAWQDSANGIICYILYGGSGPVAIDCVADAMVESPDAGLQSLGSPNFTF